MVADVIKIKRITTSDFFCVPPCLCSECSCSWSVCSSALGSNRFNGDFQLIFALLLTPRIVSGPG